MAALVIVRGVIKVGQVPDRISTTQKTKYGVEKICILGSRIYLQCPEIRPGRGEIEVESLLCSRKAARDKTFATSNKMSLGDFLNEGLGFHQREDRLSEIIKKLEYPRAIWLFKTLNTTMAHNIHYFSWSIMTSDPITE
jgi:hypothetical protein